MNTTERCPQCGTPVTGDAPQGFCPGCLLKEGMESAPVKNREPGNATDAYQPGYSTPDLETVAARFPQMEIIEVLGQGGMGVVYKARQKMLDRIVALKVLPPEVSRDPAFAERFTREARALAKLTHPNIVVIYEFGEREGLFFLVMEFVEGVNLRQAITTQCLAPKEALAIVPQICDALQYAHEEGVVHRDIKPENVLVDKRGRVKIADFGLAKLVGRSPTEVTLTASHQVMGTLHYMAPEQLERPLEVDHRADIYSLGVVFYELLTGELPLGRFKLPSEKAPLDARLDEVVLKSLEREPNERYQLAGEVKTDVERISRSFHAPPVAEAPQPARPARPVRPKTSVPFTVGQHSVEAGQGVVSFDGDQCRLEFDIPESILRFPFFADFKPGLHEVSIPLYEIASARFEAGWIFHTITLQTHSVRRFANIPSAEQAKVRLRIDKQDRAAAEEVTQAIHRALGRARDPERAAGKPPVARKPMPGDYPVASLDAALADAPMRSVVPHYGQIIFGVVMLSLGFFMVIFDIVFGRTYTLWAGMGFMFGGASIAGSGVRCKVPRGKRLYGPNPGQLLLSTTMLSLGSMMFVLGIVSRSATMVWVGVGVTMGGGGVASGAWHAKKRPVYFVMSESASAKFIMAAVMLVMGSFLFAMGVSMHHMALYFWVGFGLIIGGGGVASGAWTTKRGEAPVVSENEPRRSSAEGVQHVLRAVRAPGVGLVVAGVLNLTPLFMIVGAIFVIFARIVGLDTPIDDPPDGALLSIWMMVVAAAVVFVLTPVAVFMILAGLKLTRLQWYSGSCLASVIAMLPCQPAFLVGLPIGAWSLFVLMRRDVKAAFEHVKDHPIEIAAQRVAKKP